MSKNIETYICTDKMWYFFYICTHNNIMNISNVGTLNQSAYSMYNANLRNFSIFIKQYVQAKISNI